MKKLYFDRIEWTNDKGEPHRLDGPAIEWSSGDKVWLQNGNLHRVDGPAMVYINGDKEWWLDGVEYRTEEQWFNTLTSDAQTDYLFKLGEK